MRAGAVVGVLALACAGCAMELRVATHVGSRFLDKKVDVTVDGDATVGDVKRQVRARFPGAPPVSLQRLFLGSRLLRDDEAAASLGEDEDEDEDDADEGDDAEEGDEAARPAATKVSLILDVVPPVGDARARPPAGLEDRLRAYAAESVALERVRALLAAELAGDDDEDDDEEGEESEAEEEEATLLSPKIAAAVRAHERALLAACETDLAAHAARVTSGVVRDGRGGRGGRGARDPRRAFFADAGGGSARDKLALGLDVDWRESAKLTAGLCVAANVGVKDAGRKAFLLSLAPLVVLARTRPARFLAKTAWYALPRGPATADGFFQCLLNAPQQIMLALDEPAYLDELYRPLVADADLAAAREADEEDYDDDEGDDEGDAEGDAADDDDEDD